MSAPSHNAEGDDARPLGPAWGCAAFASTRQASSSLGGGRPGPCARPGEPAGGTAVLQDTQEAAA